MLLPILTLLIFAVTLGLSISFFYFAVESPLARRKMMTRFAAVQEVAVRKDEVPDILRRELLSGLPVLNRILGTVPGVPRLRLFLQQGAIRMQIGTFVLICLAIPVFVFVATLIGDLPLFACLAIAGFAGVIPFLSVATIRGRRFNKFEEQFPDAMDLLGRAVRAGHAFTTGFELIGKELADPVAEEFRTAFRQQNLGLPLRDALENMMVRMPLPDVRIFVSSLQIQRESGGNLGEILDTMSSVVRERFKLRRQIRTFTAEGRMSSYALSAIPFAALAALYAIKPEYIIPLFTDPMGQKALTFAAILQVIGYFVINWIIKIKV
jgi:tight adherence protein B